MKFNLPQFNPSAFQRQWVNEEAQTARFISALWSASGRKHRDPGFIALLVRCAWTNVRKDGSGWEATRIWRNQNIGDYLGVEYVSDKQLAEAISRAFPRLKRIQWLLGTHTGFAHYYKALRTETISRRRTRPDSNSRPRYLPSQWADAGASLSRSVSQVSDHE
jgi:hypothetical protein